MALPLGRPAGTVGVPGKVANLYLNVKGVGKT